MKFALVAALFGSPHRHRYNDSSGDCDVCGEEHYPHDWQESNGRCGICNKEHPHSWNNGKCTVCGYAGCEHANGWRAYNDTNHSCNVCGYKSPHVYGEDFLHDSIYCRSCLECGFQKKHSCVGIDQSHCGTCSSCGDSFDNHVWSGGNGKCVRCGYKCWHPSIDKFFYCDVCRMQVVNGPYWVTTEGVYKGSYAAAGSINGQSYYRQCQYNADTGKWEKKDYFLVVLDIDEPTQFGGDYAYECHGCAFVKSVASFPINTSLLSGSGRKNIHLKQYSLDGKFLFEGTYTSDDCIGLHGNLPA